MIGTLVININKKYEHHFYQISLFSYLYIIDLIFILTFNL